MRGLCIEQPVEDKKKPAQRQAKKVSSHKRGTNNLRLTTYFVSYAHLI